MGKGMRPLAFAVVAAAGNPAGEGHRLVDVFQTQLAAAMGVKGEGVSCHEASFRLCRPVPGQAALPQTARQA